MGFGTEITQLIMGKMISHMAGRFLMEIPPWLCGSRVAVLGGHLSTVYHVNYVLGF